MRVSAPTGVGTRAKRAKARMSRRIMGVSVTMNFADSQFQHPSPRKLLRVGATETQGDRPERPARSDPVVTEYHIRGSRLVSSN